MKPYQPRLQSYPFDEYQNTLSLFLTRSAYVSFPLLTWRQIIGPLGKSRQDPPLAPFTSWF